MVLEGFAVQYSSERAIIVIQYLYTIFSNGSNERAAKHGIEAFRNKNLFSCKLWPTYVEIIGDLKAISLMRQFPDCYFHWG